MTFSSLSALVEHYYSHPLPNHDSLCLQQPYGYIMPRLPCPDSTWGHCLIRSNGLSPFGYLIRFCNCHELQSKTCCGRNKMTLPPVGQVRLVHICNQAWVFVGVILMSVMAWDLARNNAWAEVQRVHMVAVVKKIWYLWGGQWALYTEQSCIMWGLLQD